MESCERDEEGEEGVGAGVGGCEGGGAGFGSGAGVEVAGVQREGCVVEGV